MNLKLLEIASWRPTNPLVLIRFLLEVCFPPKLAPSFFVGGFCSTDLMYDLIVERSRSDLYFLIEISKIGLDS